MCVTLKKNVNGTRYFSFMLIFHPQSAQVTTFDQRILRSGRHLTVLFDLCTSSVFT